jgi:hypothetical protein
MNDLTAILLIAIKVFLESRVLLLIFFTVLGLSVFLYYYWRGLNFSESVTAGLMVIFLVTGLIIFYVGVVFATDANSFIPSNSTSSQPQSTSDFISMGWGLIGFGVAIISIGFSYFGNIESQRNIAMVRVLLFRGRHFTRAFQESLTPRQILIIALVWIIGALVILFNNLFFNPWQSTQNPWLLIIPTAVGWIMGLFGFFFLAVGLYRDRIIRQRLIRRIVTTFRWIRRQIIVYCIFCYLFPSHFPEILES